MLLTKAKRIVLTSSALLIFAGIGIPHCADFFATADTKAQDSADRGAADLQALDTKLKSVASKVAPCSVSVGAHQFGGSGVIVSADGMILTQGHCAPEPTVKIGLPGGTEEIADALGRDEVYDLAVFKLRGPGPYPHVEFAETMPKLASWIVTAGYPYPLGYQKGRPPEVRLGKLLFSNELHFQADCPQDGGDSGAPYFDLDGRLIGIVDGGSYLADLLFPHGTWNLDGRGWMRGTPLNEVRSRFDRMARGEKNIQPAPGETTLSDRGLRLHFSDLIPAERHSRGIKTLEAFREANAAVKESVVEMLDGDERAALGVVVEADGFVLTKASEVPDGVRCRLADGRVLAAEVVGVDPAYDMALLRLPARGLRAVAWASGEPAVGTLATVAGPGPLPVKLGIVSLPLQISSGPFETTVPRRPILPAMPPAVLGSGVPGRGYWVEYVEGNAAAAGIRPGDLLVSVAGVPVRSHEDVIGCVQGHRGGSQVPVQLLREGKTHRLMLSLKTEAPTEGNYGRRHVRPPAPWFGLDDFISRHRVKPPAAIPVAVPVIGYECGGPLIGVDGKALGWVCDRAAPTFARVIPADRVVERLKDLKQGRPLAALPPQAATAEPPAPKAVAVTLDEVLAKLKERTDRYRSLLVEYDIMTEADADPQLLLAWQLFDFRNYQERHRIAFLGPKRLAEIIVPRVSGHLAPAYAVTLDTAAPKDVADRLAKAQWEAVQAKEAGLIHWQLLNYRQTPGMRRFVFDSNTMHAESVYGNEDTFNGFLWPTDYLANIGVRPINHNPRIVSNAWEAGNFPSWKSRNGDGVDEQAWQLPGNFARLPDCHVRPNEEQVDGAGCVVLEAPLKEGTETIWLDPGLAYAPRKWEVRIGNRLVWRRTNKDFREFAPGCWLPLECTASFGPPAWTSLVPPDQPVYTQRMSLRYARVNDVPDSIFTKEG